MYTLHDVDTHIPTFFHITAASIHGSKAMSGIVYETSSYYIVDRDYNKFSQLFSINQIEAYFVIRAKKNLQCKTIKWKRRLPKNALPHCTIELTSLQTIIQSDYGWCATIMRSKIESLYFLRMQLTFLRLLLLNSTRIVGR